MTTVPVRSRPEEAFMRSVADLLMLRGFRVAHIRPAMTAKGYRTPVMFDGAGLPDIIAVRKPALQTPVANRAGRERPALMLALELKAGKNKPTPAQTEWLEHFAEVPGCVARVLYPNDWSWLMDITA